MLIHAHYPRNKDNVIIMLHGTGGDEHNLKDISHFIDPLATLIGIRGAVEENGMNRYFKRYPDGTFDQKDLAKQTHSLYNEIARLIKTYELENAKITLLGYSNGANIAINIFKEFETNYHKAILFHPSPVRPDVPLKQQKDLSVFLTSGKDDFFITPEQFIQVKDQFTNAQSFSHEGGHELIHDELVKAKEFYSSYEA